MGDKYHRLNIFVDKISPQPLRETFLKKMLADSVHRNDTLDNYLCARKKELCSKSKKIFRNDQWDLLFPRIGHADISSWDITLVALLIDILFSKQLNYIEKHAIDEIKSVRNYLKHMPDTSMSNEEFDKLWTRLEKATIILAQQITQVPPYEIEIQKLIDDAKINNMPDLGGAFQNMLKRSIMELNANTEEMKDNLRSLTSATEDNLSCSRESQAILKDSCVQKVGPGGRTVKRLKIFDNVFNHLNHSNKISESEISSPLQNMIDFSVLHAERKKDISTVSKTVEDDAKAKLKKHKVIMITGPRKSGKTTLALKLTSIYQKGEYIIINNPDDMKHVSLNKICLVVIEDFAGKYQFDVDSTNSWMRKFEEIYSAVKAGKLNVILTSDDKMLEKCKVEFENHPIFDITVHMTVSDVTIKQEKVCDCILTMEFRDVESINKEVIVKIKDVICLKDLLSHMHKFGFTVMTKQGIEAEIKNYGEAYAAINFLDAIKKRPRYFPRFIAALRYTHQLVVYYIFREQIRKYFTRQDDRLAKILSLISEAERELGIVEELQRICYQTNINSHGGQCQQ